MTEVEHSAVQLVRDDRHRARIGEWCREQVIRYRGDPARMVRRCEEVYAAVFTARCAATAERRTKIRERDQQELERLLRDRAAALDRREGELESREAELERAWKARRAFGRSQRLRSVSLSPRDVPHDSSGASPVEQERPQLRRCAGPLKRRVVWSLAPALASLS
jgi:hypothetical protein